MATLEQEFREHVRLYQQRCHEVDVAMQDLRNMQAENARQIAALVASVQRLTDDTAGVRMVYNSVQGTMRTGAAVQAFFLFLGKCGIIGAGIAAIIQWVLDHFQ